LETLLDRGLFVSSQQYLEVVAGKGGADAPPVFVPVDRDTGETYVHPAKAAEEPTIRLLLGDRRQESLTVYTDGSRAYESLDSDDAFDRQYVVHGEGEYADGDVHVNACESHASLARR
jgi:transposase